MKTIAQLAARTRAALDRATAATEKTAASRGIPSRLAYLEQEAWEAYSRARREEQEARRATPRRSA